MTTLYLEIHGPHVRPNQHFRDKQDLCRSTPISLRAKSDVAEEVELWPSKKRLRPLFAGLDIRSFESEIMSDDQVTGLVEFAEIQLPGTRWRQDRGRIVAQLKSVR